MAGSRGAKAAADVRIAVWLRFTLGAAFVLCAAAAAFGYWVAFDDTERPAQSTSVVIAEGSSLSEISHQLGAAGIVRWPIAFVAYERLRDRNATIQAAQYTFGAHLALPAVAAVLSQGGRPPTVWITIPEGFTAAQIGAVLQAHGIGSKSEFVAVAQDTDLQLDGVETRGLEGYLFPDTYQLRRDATARDAADLMTATFLRKLPRDYRSAARKLKLTIPQIVTAASLIEREARVDVERPIMAGIYYNRLRRGMPLQVDATIEYALPQHKTELSLSDLKIDSPYNTYLYTGLPPTPIANPGAASLNAAFHPAVTDYLYYVYKGGGRHAFSTTLEQQIEAERRYLR
jgi:UPF0755 protein